MGEVVEVEGKRARRVVGRPPSLTIDRILDAAVQIGLDQLTIRRLAAALGVAPSSIYEYFPSRDAIVAGAIRRSVSGLTLRDPTGIGWRDYVTDFAASIVENRVQHPEYIRFHVDGNDTAAILAEVIRQFVDAMGSYGCGMPDALWLLRRLGPLTMSAAIGLHRSRTLAARGIDPAAADSLAGLGAVLGESGLETARTIVDSSDADAVFAEELALLLDRFETRVAASAPTPLIKDTAA